MLVVLKMRELLCVLGLYWTTYLVLMLAYMKVMSSLLVRVS